MRSHIQKIKNYFSRVFNSLSTYTGATSEVLPLFSVDLFIMLNKSPWGTNVPVQCEVVT